MQEQQSKSKKILLGITGSVAAYKAAELARLLVKNGYEVRCILSDSAEKFVGKILFEAITGNPVSDSLWDNSDPRKMEHITAADWCDLLVIAPCTAHTIGALAAGLGDSTLLASALACRAPLLIAPAMNVNMWEHAAVQENLEKLKNRGAFVINPESGDLACGWNGSGRLAEPENIYHKIAELTSTETSAKPLAGKKVLISAGPTREPIDDVRFISNRSSGKMGIALAREARRLGADVTLVHGPITEALPGGITSIAVTSADQMKEAVLSQTFSSKQQSADRPAIIIMTAAVADFKVKNAVSGKIKRGGGIPKLELEPNPDILAMLGSKKSENGYKPLLVGFAVESCTELELITELQRKLTAKNCDLIVGNLADEAFEGDTNRVWIYHKNTSVDKIPLGTKTEVARLIWEQGIIKEIN